VPKDSTHFGYQSIPTHAKTPRVGTVFHSVAKHYDLMNDLLSFGLHRLWKRQAIANLQLEPHHHVLDLAGGTGDLSSLILKKLNEQGRLIFSDINDSMLNIGRNRLLDEGFVQQFKIVQANAESLPFPNNAFHRIIIGFGLRNVTHPSLALSEMFRVLKPGGRVIILEFSHPRSEQLSRCYNAYSFNVLPWLGKMICNDEASYQYLVESIRMHPSQEALKMIMQQAGFEQVDYQNMLDGIVAIHKGFKF